MSVGSIRWKNCSAVPIHHIFGRQYKSGIRSMQRITGNCMPCLEEQIDVKSSINGKEIGQSYHINQAASEAEKTIDAMEDVNAYIEIIKENIEYDHYMKYSDWQDREFYDELFEIICEVVCVKHKTVRIGGDDYPYELVKSKFLKLNSSHLNYVIGCMKNTTTKITRQSFPVVVTPLLLPESQS